MPSKNVVKQYIENGYYHIYNRGVEKRDIFLDEQDCSVFLHYIKLYLSPIDELDGFKIFTGRINRFIPLNLSDEVDLLTFALMPNHVHLQIKQYTKNGIIKFMQRLSTSYVMYFNKKYKRVGSLFQGTYKAALVELEQHHLHLSRYIHLNPMIISTSKINFLHFSSYPYYLGTRKASWIKPSEILNYFQAARRRDIKDVFSYQSFVEDYKVDSNHALGDLLLENDEG